MCFCRKGITCTIIKGKTCFAVTFWTATYQEHSYRNTSPTGREHEPFIRAAGSNPGVPISFERSINTILSPKEYNLQRELRRNYEVLFVCQFSYSVHSTGRFLAYGHLFSMIDGGNQLSWMVLAGLYFIIFLKEGELE